MGKKNQCADPRVVLKDIDTATGPEMLLMPDIDIDNDVARKMSYARAMNMRVELEPLLVPYFREYAVVCCKYIKPHEPDMVKYVEVHHDALHAVKRMHILHMTSKYEHEHMCIKYIRIPPGKFPAVRRACKEGHVECLFEDSKAV